MEEITRAEIDANNKLIADFMDMKYGDERKWSKEEGWTHAISSLDQFRFSWDWIMPVIEKLNRSNIWDEVDISHLSICLVSCDIDGVYKEIVDWIKWDNGDKE